MAADLRCAATKIQKVINNRIKQLEPKSQQALQRSYNHIEVIITANDIARMVDERQDDEIVTIKTQDLYDLAEQAIIACSEHCDGTKKECKLRDQMLTMRIPVYDEYAVCCPYIAKHEPVGIVGEALLKAVSQ